MNPGPPNRLIAPPRLDWREFGSAVGRWSGFGAIHRGPVRFQRGGQRVDLPGEARGWGRDLRGSRRIDRLACLAAWLLPWPPHY